MNNLGRGPNLRKAGVMYGKIVGWCFFSISGGCWLVFVLYRFLRDKTSKPESSSGGNAYHFSDSVSIYSMNGPLEERCG